jgi:predicted O-methyltransferase YrrM
MRFFSAPGSSSPKCELPRREVADLFPGIEKSRAKLSLAHIPEREDMIMPLTETLVLAAICQWLQPQKVFEIGTYTGATTLAFALNSPDRAEIYTLDLPSSHPKSGGSETEIGSVYRAAEAGRKVKQLWGESMEFDFTPFRTGIDLVLIDGNHALEFVSSDSTHALQMIRPGGVIIWDDYLWDPKYPECAGVKRCVNQLAQKLNIANLAGTRLAVYQHAR